jgi:hypothetical protein
MRSKHKQQTFAISRQQPQPSRHEKIVVAMGIPPSCVYVWGVYGWGDAIERASFPSRHSSKNEKWEWPNCTHTQHTHTIYSTSITSRWSSRSVNKYSVNNTCPVWLCVGDKLAEKHTRRKESVFFLFSLPRVCTLNMLRRCDAVDNFSIQHWIGIVGWTHAVMLNRLSRNFVKNFKTNKKKSWVESVEKKK